MTNPILEQLGNAPRGQSQPTTSNPILRNMNIPPDVMNRFQSMLDAGGGDPKQAFFNACNQNGLNPNNIIDEIRSYLK